MFFATTHDVFKATGVFADESDLLTLERSKKNVSIIADSEEDQYSEAPRLQVVSVRMPHSFQELRTELWTFESLRMNEGKLEYELVFDGAAFTRSLQTRRHAHDDGLQRAFLYGGEIEITVTDGHDATHVFLRLDYGPRSDL